MLKIYLTQARELIADRSRWTAGSFARTSDGTPSTSAEGTCWCARGALRKVAGFEHERQLTDILNLAAVQALNERRGIVYVNDRLGHEAVLKVYDYAIAQVQG